MSNANIWGGFRGSKKAEKHWPTESHRTNTDAFASKRVTISCNLNNELRAGLTKTSGILRRTTPVAEKNWRRSTNIPATLWWVFDQRVQLPSTAEKIILTTTSLFSVSAVIFCPRPVAPNNAYSTACSCATGRLLAARSGCVHCISRPLA